ncbi:hypothetical protein DV495_003281 [Geotrichum candidum]|uniref:Metacaspase-1 n=1 Tax=Geotrichum candidum TaxID=1173061 RepID=A0A0J9X509_GEOCN|nr:hypothetical protein DV452_002316 [Geotrichum candidum]KAI9211620.1 hypothetical protein DS838_003483 [Geotrichum bryndzae]KAF5126727.1 hypothetical protein DV495_003281 [Geotrichum candidum]KAF7498047.1 hypothetical protein DV113_003912 [Geotrichum candidum]KAI8133552.1 hypothetical protein DUD61_002772 [Geotrichum candidum]
MSYPGQGYNTYGGGQNPDYNNNGGYGYGAPPPNGPPPGAPYGGGYGGGGYQGGYGGPPPGGPPPGAPYGGGYGGDRYQGGPPPGAPYGGYQGGPPSGPPSGYEHRNYDNQNNEGGYGGGYGGGNNYNNNNNSGGGYANDGNIGQHFASRNSNFQLPSNEAQSFGIDGYNFQYSNCSGRRKALLIGINYIGQKAALRGCINDVHNVKNFLQQHGYREDDMVVLTDDQSNQRALPTRENILRGMRWLVKDAQTNDSLFLHYSGHGGQAEDTNGDEEDGFDEVIYPLDFEKAGHITDDEIHTTVVSPLRPGVRLTALFDSCHSGTVLDLPYVYSTKGVLKEPNLLKEAGSGLLDAVTSYSRGDISGVMNSVQGLFKRVTNGNDGYEKTKATKTAPCDAILISGCKDSQTSADAFENGQATGAMSHAFITVMNANPNQSYLTLLKEMREVLKDKYDQKPQLSSSHPIDCNLKFIF